MPSVTLIKPVTHGDEDLNPGDPIDDLTDKEARRLVALGVAVMDGGDDLDVDIDEDDGGTDGDAEDLEPEEDEPESGDASATGGLSSDVIMAMKKDELLKALADVNVEVGKNETVPQLRDKLLNAVAKGTGDDV